MLFDYSRFATLLTHTGNGSLAEELQKYRSRREESLTPFQASHASSLYKAVADNNRAAFDACVDGVSAVEMYELLDKYLLMRAAFCTNPFFLKYFLVEVEKLYRGKTHQCVMRLIGLYTATHDYKVQSNVCRALENINKVERINWGIWSGKILNETFEKFSVLPDVKQENLFRLMCEQGAYFTNINQQSMNTVNAKLKKWYRSLNEWPKGDYLQNETAKNWLAYWLFERKINPVDALKDADDHVKVVLMELALM